MIFYRLIGERYFISGQTFDAKDTIKRVFSGVWVPENKSWILAPETTLDKILMAFPNAKQFEVDAYRFLERKDTFKFKDEIKARGGIFDGETKKWKVPKNFDESFMDKKETEEAPPKEAIPEDFDQDAFLYGDDE